MVLFIRRLIVIRTLLIQSLLNPYWISFHDDSTLKKVKIPPVHQNSLNDSGILQERHGVWSIQIKDVWCMEPALEQMCGAVLVVEIWTPVCHIVIVLEDVASLQGSHAHLRINSGRG